MFSHTSVEFGTGEFHLTFDNNCDYWVMKMNTYIEQVATCVKIPNTYIRKVKCMLLLFPLQWKRKKKKHGKNNIYESNWKHKIIIGLITSISHQSGTILEYSLDFLQLAGTCWFIPFYVFNRKISWDVYCSLWIYLLDWFVLLCLYLIIV